MGNPSWQAQIKGTKKWTLEPPPECAHVCDPKLEVTVNPGEISEYLHLICMDIDTLIYRHPGSRLAFHLLDFGKTLQELSKIFVEHGLHVTGVQFLNPGLTVVRLKQWLLLRPLFYQQMNACTQKSQLAAAAPSS